MGIKDFFVSIFEESESELKEELADQKDLLKDLNKRLKKNSKKKKGFSKIVSFFEESPKELKEDIKETEKSIKNIQKKLKQKKKKKTPPKKKKKINKKPIIITLLIIALLIAAFFIGKHTYYTLKNTCYELDGEGSASIGCLDLNEPNKVDSHVISFHFRNNLDAKATCLVTTEVTRNKLTISEKVFDIGNFESGQRRIQELPIVLPEGDSEFKLVGSCTK